MGNCSFVNCVLNLTVIISKRNVGGFILVFRKMETVSKVQTKSKPLATTHVLHTKLNSTKFRSTCISKNFINAVFYAN